MYREEDDTLLDRQQGTLPRAASVHDVQSNGNRGPPGGPVSPISHSLTAPLVVTMT